ncbi:MAG: hypothetical protein WCG47_23850, partial [Dermatophilaceae bacterium]
MVGDEPSAQALLLPGGPPDPLAHGRGTHAELHRRLVLRQTLSEQVDDLPALRAAPPQHPCEQQQRALGILRVAAASAPVSGSQVRVGTQADGQLPRPGVRRL